MAKKTWDFAPEPNDAHRRIASQHRENQLTDRLTQDAAYARNHEALRRAAELLVESAESFLDRARRHASARGDAPDEIALTFEEEREYHVSRITTMLLREAVPRVMARKKR